MALAWSLDKLGPICRSVEDTAIVLDAIYGADGQDRSVRDAAFNWDADIDWKTLRVGYLKSEFERGPEPVFNIVTADGVNAVLLNIRSQPDGSTLEIARQLQQDLNELRKELPPDVKLGFFYDQSGIVRA